MFYAIKTNKMHSFIYIYSIIFISTLHVSSDRMFHHQEFSLFTVFTALYRLYCVCNTVYYAALLMMND